MDKPLIYLGTSGLQLPIPKRDFPPEFAEKSRLNFYASLFNTIEINSSFYKIPQANTLERWAAEVPADFRFTFKLWKGITHQKGLQFNIDDIARFMDVISHASNRQGCLLVQFPPGLAINAFGQLERLLACLEGRWPLAVEFRNKSWYTGETYELLKHFRAGMVLHDIPASATPLMPLSEKFVYLRFHGPEGKYRGSYADDFLHEYAMYINEWASENKTVYAYFNNTMGDALKNLVTLKRYL
jgi:uncharacterized protein YecE (DUF72 family)